MDGEAGVSEEAVVQPGTAARLKRTRDRRLNQVTRSGESGASRLDPPNRLQHLQSRAQLGCFSAQKPPYLLAAYPE